MGSGVARQCSRNRCFAQWTVWIPHRGRRSGPGRANSKKDRVTGLIPRFCALQRLSRKLTLLILSDVARRASGFGWSRSNGSGGRCAGPGTPPQLEEVVSSDFKIGVGARAPRRVRSRPPPRREQGAMVENAGSSSTRRSRHAAVARFKLNTDLLARPRWDRGIRKFSRSPLSSPATEPASTRASASIADRSAWSRSSALPLPSRAPPHLLARRPRTSRI
jgi:hypothetical protein